MGKRERDKIDLTEVRRVQGNKYYNKTLVMGWGTKQNTPERWKGTDAPSAGKYADAVVWQDQHSADECIVYEEIIVYSLDVPAILQYESDSKHSTVHIPECPSHSLHFFSTTLDSNLETITF